MKRTISFLLSALLIVGFLIFPIRTQAATLTSAVGLVSTKQGSLNVRSSATTNASVISSLYKGAYITLISKFGSWWKVEYAAGKYGYCHADYILEVSSTAATVTTWSSSLNVRSGPGTSYPRIGSLNKGEVILVLSESAGWYRVLYHGTKVGYVSGQYLTVTAKESYASVSLGVPSFKQTDTRWANVQIGSSGKTMAKIGCATTAIAMMESYRTGTVIYPDAMSKKLKYTSSGSVYWPSYYTVVTGSNPDFSSIYKLLQQGKPVLFGARNSYGGQHWVVITGYTGSNALSASNFTIHDPGSNTRKTLQQFMNAYPAFYKYFHY